MIKKDGAEIRIRQLFLLGMGLIFLFFVLGELFMPGDNYFRIEKARLYSGKWTQVFQDGSECELKTPCSLEGERGEPVTVQTVLPEEIDDATVLSFYVVHQEMECYIEEELRQAYRNEDGVFFTAYPVRAYVPLFLSKEDAGKTLTLRITGWGKYGPGKMYDVDMGSMDQAVASIVGGSGFKILVEVTILLIALTAGVICLILSRIMHRKIPMSWLCAAVFLLMLWGICDSALRQFLFPNSAVAASVAYLATLLMPAALCRYLDEIQSKRYHSLYRILQGVDLAVFFGCFALNLAGVDFTDMSTGVYLFLLAVILICAVNLIREAIGGYVREYKYVASGIVITCLFGMAEVAMLLADLDKIRQLGLCISLAAMVILAGVQTVVDIRASLQREKERANEANLAKEELLSTLSGELLPLMRNLDGEVRKLRPEIGREKARNLETEVATALSFFTSIHDLSTLPGEICYAQPERYEMAAFQESVQSFLDVRTKSQGLEGMLVVEPGLPAHLCGCLQSNKQVVINLIEYAVRHTQEGSVVFSICSHRSGGKFFLKLSVADTGSALSDDMIKRLELSGNDPLQSGDIRLLSVRQIVNRQGGSIEVESGTDEGLLITVLLPQGTGEEREGDVFETQIYDEARTMEAQMPYEEMAVPKKTEMFGVPSIPENLMPVRGVELPDEYGQDSHDHVSESDGKREHAQTATAEKNEAYETKAEHAQSLGGQVPEVIRKRLDTQDACLESESLRSADVMGAIRERADTWNVGRESEPLQAEKTGEKQTAVADSLRGWMPMEHGVERKSRELINTHMGIFYCGEDRELYMEVLQSYVNVGGEYQEKLRACVEKEDWENYRILVHAVKSTSLNIGAEALSDLARQQESAVREGNKEEILLGWQQMLEQYRDVMQEAKRILTNALYSGPGPSLTESEGGLDAVAACLRDYDMDAALKELDRLQASGTEDGVLLEQIREAVEDFDYERALGYCSRVPRKQ